MSSPLRIALAGNPNAGKTTIFNALTGSHHKVGNYPGVTVERREGTYSLGGQAFQVCDLPGTYSLTAYSLDEQVARDYLLQEAPDLVVCVMDSTSLERQLHLCLQLQELGRPMLGVLNMSDEAEAQGLTLDCRGLEEAFGLPFVKTVGSRGRGIEDLRKAISRYAAGPASPRRTRYSPAVESSLSALVEALAQAPALAAYPPRWLALKLLEKDGDNLRLVEGSPGGLPVAHLAEAARSTLEADRGRDTEILLSEERYRYIKEGLAAASVRLASAQDRSRGNFHADRILMHPVLGLPAFLVAMWAMFQLTFTLGAFPQAWLETFFGWLGGVAGAAIPPGFFNLLVVNGIIGGVGAVFSFVPLIVLLFLFLALLEDLGYMARAAFLTDRLLSSFGLHGQSFLPLMLGFGCSVPAIMGARTLKSPRDRIATIVAIPFMTCGAKLPVYVLLAGAFFPAHQGAVVMGFYGLGVVLALASALLFKKTLLRGEATPFVLELPPYRVPTLKSVLWHVWEKSSSYVKKMGTVILAMSILVWVITTFPVLSEARAAELGATSPAALAEARLAHSTAGTLGRAMEPILRPLGFNWKIGVASVTGIAAKEVVVSTLGILYQADPEGEGSGGPEGEAPGLTEALRRSPDFSPLVALVLILTTLIFPPCLAALASIRGELGWRWVGIVVAYQLGLGWLLGALVFQVGRLLGLGLA